MESKQVYTTASLSGGKDSLAMVLRLAELEEHVDEVVFVDTGWEFPETLRVIDQAKEVLPYKVTVIDMSEHFHYYFWDFLVTKGKHKGEHRGFPTLSGRWCTREKGRKLDRHNKAKAKENEAGGCINYIGYASDERNRIEGKELYADKRITRKFPLIEWGWTEADCLKYCYDQGFDFDGYYTRFKRGGCFCCPFQPLNSLRSLFRYYPGFWAKLKEMQDISPVTFKPGKTVYDLERIFKLEKRQIEFDFMTKQREVC